MACCWPQGPWCWRGDPSRVASYSLDRVFETFCYFLLTVFCVHIHWRGTIILLYWQCKCICVFVGACWWLFCTYFINKYRCIVCCGWPSFPEFWSSLSLFVGGHKPLGQRMTEELNTRCTHTRVHTYTHTLQPLGRDTVLIRQICQKRWNNL